MSVGKTADDGNVSVFTKEDVKIFKEEDILITYKGEPIMISKRDERGRYHIPLVQQRLAVATKDANQSGKKYLKQANSVYDFPPTEEAVKWMHTACGYPVKSTWLKAIKAGNFTGWPVTSERIVSK